MKVLLDEDLPQRLRHLIGKYEVQTAAYAGFSGFKNGKLMESLAAAGFQVFVTGDKNIPHQQNLLEMSFGTVVLSSQSLPVLTGCIGAVQAAVDASVAGSLVRVLCQIPDEETPL